MIVFRPALSIELNATYFSINLYIYIYIMVVPACVQAGQRNRPDRFAKLFLRVIDSCMEIVRKIVNFYAS